jgi:ATP-dependent exoDNAse (exonuclease V) beta subunit
MNPTAEQLAAIGADDPRFTIRAAAGSGKTFVLTERFLRHVIELGHPPHKILTITFTRKAAAEMKRRIVRKLAEQGRVHDAQLAETGPIQTIHSFCERVLRENSLAAGLDPQFEILAEGQGGALIEEAMRKAMVEAYEEDDLARDLIRTLAGQGAWGSSGSDAKVADAAKRALDKLRGSGLDPQQLMFHLGDGPAMLESWLQGLELDMGLDGTLYVSPLERMRYLADQSRSKLQMRPQWAALEPAKIEKAAEESAGLLRLACRTWMILEEMMAAEQTFDFAALESMAVRMVTGSPNVQKRLQSQFAAVLVDESQDVNPMQYRLIDSLGLESEMMVGDPQQSIYGFRQADRKLFIERAQAAPAMELSRNFRSDEGVLSFVDQLFGRIWPDDYRPMLAPSGTDDPFSDPVWPPCEGVELWPTTAKDSAQTAAWIKALIDEGEKPRDIAVLVRNKADALAIADHLRAFGVPHQVSGGTEKFFTRMEVRDLANAMQALTDPADQFAWLAFLHSPFVGLSLDSIVLLSSEEIIPDALATFEAPRESDAAAISRLDVWVGELMRSADRVPAWELMGQLLAKSPFLEQLARLPNGRQQIANVRKLLRLAAEQPLFSGSEFAERIRNIQILQHKEGDAPAEDEDANLVSLMTIHKAKGLEWDVVVVPGHFKPMDTRWREVAVDPLTGSIAATWSALDHPGKTWLHARERTAQREEEIRVMYVALTRARRRLCVGISEGPNQAHLAGLISHHLGYPDRLWGGLMVRGNPPR